MWLITLCKFKQSNLKRAEEHFSKGVIQMVNRHMRDISSHQGKQIHLYLLEWLPSGWDSRWWWACGENGMLIHCWWEYKLAQSLWKNKMEFPQKTKNVCIIESSNSTSVYVPKISENKISNTYLHSMVIAALFTIDKMRRQLKCPSVDEWTQRVWYITQWNIIQSWERRISSSCSSSLLQTFSLEKWLVFQSMNLGTGLPGLNPSCDIYKPYNIGEIT